MAGPQVDKIVQGYKDTIEKQDELIDSLQEQNRQLLESQTTATQFYSELLAKPEAVERPGDAPPKGVTVG